MSEGPYYKITLTGGAGAFGIAFCRQNPGLVYHVPGRDVQRASELLRLVRWRQERKDRMRRLGQAAEKARLTTKVRAAELAARPLGECCFCGTETPTRTADGGGFMCMRCRTEIGP